jgi:hypothetical protein
MIVLADMILVAGGWGLLRLACGERWRFGLVGGLALSFLAGAAALAFFTTLLAVLGLPLWLTVPALVLLFAAGVARGRPERAREVASGAAGVIALVLGGRLVLAAASSQVAANDEYAIWALRGRGLTLAGELDPQLFANAAAQYQHLDYPLLVPSLIAWSDRFAGSVLDGAAHAQTALLVAALFGVVAWGVFQLAGRLAAVVAVLLCTIPTGTAAFSQRLYADLPAAAFAMATLLLVMVWLQEEHDDRLLAAASITTAGALYTKNEGALFAVVSLLAALVLARRGRRLVAGAVASALLAYLPWALWTRFNDLNNDLVNATTLAPERVADNLSRLGTIADGFSQYWPAPGWALPLFAVAVALAVYHGRERLAAAAVATAALSVAGMAAIFVLTPLDLAGHLESAAARVLLFPALVVLVGIPLLAGASLQASAAVRATGSRSV